MLTYTQKEAKAMHDALLSVSSAFKQGYYVVNDKGERHNALLAEIEAALPEPLTPVVFRMIKGECVAIFPTLAGTNDVNTCSSYQHVGQHGACDINLGKRARLAKSYEYRALKKELEGLGYRLHVVDKIAPAHHAARRLALSI
jgi:hypothetical protein